MAQRRSTNGAGRRAARRVLVLVALGVGGALLALVQTTLQAQTAHDHLHVRQAAEVSNAVRQIDGLEWRAAAGQEVGPLRAEVAIVAEMIEDVLSEDLDDHTNQTLLRDIDAYVAAVADMLDAIERGDEDAAEEIDEGRVDPAFEVVTTEATATVERFIAEAQASERTTRMLTWVIAVLGVVTVGALLWIVWETQLRHLRRAQEADANRRFRALVKGSRDVITLVRGDEASLTLASSDWGALADGLHGAAPATVGDILSPDLLEAWRRVDGRVRTEGGHHEIELSLESAAGRARHFVCHGAPSVDSSETRVWTWCDVTDQKELELQLSHQAFHDPLTGVGNRVLLQDRADHALALATRSGRPVSLLFCDLDDFKSVNDSRGHRYGDELLRAVADRIRGCLRASDTIARLGGDEFAVLLEDTDLATATVRAQQILDAVAGEVLIDEHPMFAAVSIGVAEAVPGITGDEFLRQADLAMYAAKRSGKQRVEVFDASLDRLSSDLVDLRGELRGALDEGGFELHFQPTIDLDRGKVEGVEALIRWPHPTRGNLRPDLFIPVAEATGTIIPLGRWVLAEACRAAVQLAEHRDRPLSMHVNLSPQQLHDPEFVTLVGETLATTGLPAEFLVLEVTEGSLLHDVASRDRLRDLHELGVRVAIDDFGTGYASINYLQELPVDIVKIDRSFVSGDALESDERSSFLRAIVGLAESLRIRCIAEGIEAPEQLEELRTLGCPSGQGFLWTPAVALADLPAVIARIDAVDQEEAVATRS